MSGFKNLFETLLNQQNESPLKKDSDLNDADYIDSLDQYFQRYLNEDEKEIVIPQKPIVEQ